MQIDSPKIDNVLENAAKQNVPAISAAVISKDSDLYKGHFGFKDLENKNTENKSIEKNEYLLDLFKSCLSKD